MLRTMPHTWPRSARRGSTPTSSAQPMASEISAWRTRSVRLGREAVASGACITRTLPIRAARDAAAGSGIMEAWRRSLTGRLLVAGPRLVDPNFVRTVVFLCRHDDDGRPRRGAQPSHGDAGGRRPAGLGRGAGSAECRVPRGPGAARDGGGPGPAGARAGGPGRRVGRVDPHRRPPGPGQPERLARPTRPAPWRACASSPATPDGGRANWTSRCPRATGGCCRPRGRIPSPPPPEGLWRRVLRRQAGPGGAVRRLPTRPLAQLSRPRRAAAASVEAELVALGVLHHHPVGPHLLLGPQRTVAPRPSRRAAARAMLSRRSSSATPRRPLTLRSRCTRFFTTLPSGTFWKNTRGPAPSGSTTAA